MDFSLILYGEKNFYRTAIFFKRETGMTPSEYRESLRKTAG